MDSKDHLKLKIGLEGKFSNYKIYLRDDTKCLELKGKREKVYHFLDFYRIELTEQEARLNDGQLVIPMSNTEQKNLFRDLLTRVVNYWRDTFPRYNYRDESLSVTSEAIGQIVEDETCGQLDSQDSQPMDLPLAPTLKNYFWDIKLKNSDLESLERGLPILKANRQIRYFKLFDASKFMSDNVPLLMVAASSLSSSTVIDLSGAAIDEALLKVLPVSLKINKSLRGLAVTDPQVDCGLLSDSFKFLSPFSVLRLLDVSHKSKNEKDKHEESAIIGLAANTARNLVEFRIANHNLSEEDVSNLTAAFRSSLENVAVNTLPLISLCLSGNRVKIADLAFLINNSPHLRDLQLDDCQLNVFQVMQTLETAKCEKLEQLSLMRNNFGDKPPSDCKSFGTLKNLENLKVLNLSRCQGKLATPVIGSIWTALEETQSVQFNCTLAIVDCGLSDGDVKCLKSHLSNPSRIRNLDMGGNSFADEAYDLVEVLLLQTKLQFLSIHIPKKSKLELSRVVNLLYGSTVKRLKLSKEAYSNDIVRFLDTLADNNPLEYLDISECTLKETDTSTLLRLLWNTKERFTLVINPSCLKQSLSDIEAFADRKSSLSNFEVSKAKEDTNRMTIKIWLRDELNYKKPPSRGCNIAFPVRRRLVGELVNPSTDVLMAQDKLSSSIARLQLRIPAENFGYLSTHLPDADIAKNAIEEYRTTPALHVQLLDSALDPSVLAKAQKSVENKLKEALQVALKETAKNTIESIFNELKITHGKEFCSVRPKEQELNQKVDPIIQAACRALQEQVGEIVEPMILNVNANLAQQMYTYILETITADVDQCLLKLPTRSKLLCRPSTISDPCEYATIAPVQQSPTVPAESPSPQPQDPHQITTFGANFAMPPTEPQAANRRSSSGRKNGPDPADKRRSISRQKREADTNVKRRSTEHEPGQLPRPLPKPLPKNAPVAHPVSPAAEPTNTGLGNKDETSPVVSSEPLPCLLAGRPKPARKTVSTRVIVSGNGDRISGPVTSEGLYDVPAPVAKPIQDTAETPNEEASMRPQPTRIPVCLPPGAVRPPSVITPMVQGGLKNLRTRPKTQPVEDTSSSEPEWMRVRNRIRQSRQISQSPTEETPSEAIQKEPLTTPSEAVSPSAPEDVSR